MNSDQSLATTRADHLQARAARRMLTDLSKRSAITPGSTIPMAQSAYFLIGNTYLDRKSELSFEELYTRHRMFHSQARRINNIGPEQFQRHLHAWCSATALNFTTTKNSMDIHTVHSLSLRDEPLHHEGIRAEADLLAERLRGYY